MTESTNPTRIPFSSTLSTPATSTSTSSNSLGSPITSTSVNSPATDRPKKRRKPDKDSISYAITSGLAGGIAGNLDLSL